MAGRYEGGGILALVELIEKHPIESARDFREKFHLSVDAIGVDFSYREGFLLTQSLMQDPSSWLLAAEAGWDQPVSREWILIANHFDLVHGLASKRRPKAYPRPWREAQKKTYKPTRPMSAVEVTALLRPEVTD